MTIASEIQRIKDNITEAYTSCQSKGATMPATQNSNNLAGCIDSISSGSSTLITKNITQNGTYNASSDNADGYSSVTVNVSGGGGGIGIPREVSANGVYQIPTTNFTFSLPSSATDVGDYSLYYAFEGSAGLTSVDLSSLTAISSENALKGTFTDCTNLTSVDLSSLTTINSSYGLQNTFTRCTSLTSVNLSSLANISGQNALYFTFQYCTSLTSVAFSSLTNLSGSHSIRSTFRGCTSLLTLSFPALTSTSFGNSKNHFYQMLQGVTGCTVHFPSNLQSVIGGWSDVTAGFGGTNTTVLFDLTATT